MDFYKVVTANDRKSFEKQLNEAHEEGYHINKETANDRKSFEKQLNEAHEEGSHINKDGIQVNTNGVGLNLIYTAVMCRKS